MNKRILYALVLIGLLIIILLLNSGNTTRLNVLIGNIRIMSSFAFLGFTAAGVAIGVLIK